ncbi:hypothetical protein F4814DRAFT_346803 [Daldinia grandis]|nr:hypothetical protein F4814DRAFT_346803 [Daldinia grandis]
MARLGSEASSCYTAADKCSLSNSNITYASVIISSISVFYIVPKQVPIVARSYTFGLILNPLSLNPFFCRYSMRNDAECMTRDLMVWNGANRAASRAYAHSRRLTCLPQDGATMISIVRDGRSPTSLFDFTPQPSSPLSILSAR